MSLPPRESNCPDLTTEDDRTPIEDGMRLYNYYDGKWGQVLFVTTTQADGWFEMLHDDGSVSLLNGVRVSTNKEK